MHKVQIGAISKLLCGFAPEWRFAGGLIVARF